MNRSVAIASVATYLEDFLSDTEAFRGQQLRGGGPVAEFEALLAKRCGYPYCVATCNATSALLGLAALLRVRGQTAWFPASHWEGSVSVFRLMGAKIRRYDANKIAALPRASCDAALFVVPEEYEIATFRTTKGIRAPIIVEDSLRLPSVTVDENDHSNADIQVLSFGPGKPLSLGEGGAVLFRSRKLYEKFISLTMHPERMAAESGRCAKVPLACLNARIHPVAALIGVALLMAEASA